MPFGQPIGDREKEILTAIVETFIATGEPVGSRTLARASREGLSPATIRNVMADLVDAGYLEQPHTSAGRIPSHKGYRYYVMLNYDITKKLSLWLRWAQTIYSNKRSVGSGLDEISGNKKSEIKVQARYIF